jgi:hypothetical protein
MVNVELLTETLDHIKNNPQQWRQDFWFINFDPHGNEIHEKITLDVEEINSCGTAFCFAGHAALKAGAEAPPKDRPWCEGWKVEGSPVEVWSAARLGISNEQADILFDSSNTLNDLEVLVQALIDNPEATQDELGKLTSWFEGDDYCDCGCKDEDEDEDEYY